VPAAPGNKKCFASVPVSRDETAAFIARFVGMAYGRGNRRQGGHGERQFKTHADVQAISHVHTPHLGAYSQAHAALPLLYVPNRRFRFSAELPVYINRRQAEVDFILDAIEQDREVPGIVEANGGATIWSWKGLRDLVNNIVLLEEGAQFQILGAALGGSKPFGPGVLEQQWKMGKLVPPDAHVDDDGVIHYAQAAE
jgi:ribulose-5-phosphate 4-epimerase/fuculose-1-phosphate aldolase